MPAGRATSACLRDAALVRYEYPFNESIRTMLRLEHLFDRLGQLMPREVARPPLCAGNDLRDRRCRVACRPEESDLLKELERHNAPIPGLPRQPAISEAALDEAVSRIDHAFDGLNRLPGKAGQSLTTNELLMGIRSRISIPGGTCEFDLPAYYAWQQHPPARRRADLRSGSAR